jgi:hypothetical protein
VFAVFDRPPAVTTMLAEPTEPAGVVHVLADVDTTATFVHATPPTVTAEALVKFVPSIVIPVPPAVGPESGETPVTVGATTTSHVSVHDVVDDVSYVFVNDPVFAAKKPDALAPRVTCVPA